MDTTNIELVIDDGKVTYPIRNQDGEVLGHFRFNPSDMSIRKRFEEVQKALSDMKSLCDTSKDVDTILDVLEEKMAEQLDYLFQSKDVADKFFLSHLRYLLWQMEVSLWKRLLSMSVRLSYLQQTREWIR